MAAGKFFSISLESSLLVSFLYANSICFNSSWLHEVNISYIIDSSIEKPFNPFLSIFAINSDGGKKRWIAASLNWPDNLDFISEYKSRLYVER